MSVNQGDAEDGLVLQMAAGTVEGAKSRSEQCPGSESVRGTTTPQSHASTGLSTHQIDGIALALLLIRGWEEGLTFSS